MRLLGFAPLLLSLASCAQAPPTLTIASDATFPPFHFVGDDGEATGFDIELARLLSTRAGFSPIVRVLPYDELHPGVADGAHDLVAATTGITAERSERYLFTEPYFETYQVALVRTGAGEPSSLEELSERLVGASAGGTAERAMRSLTQAVPVVVDKGSAAALADGTVDAIIVDEFDAVALARASEGRLRVLPTPVASEEYAFVLRKQRLELKRVLDEAFLSLRETGELESLRARFGVARDAEWPVVFHDRM